MGRLLTTGEAAERLHLSEWTIRDLVKAGSLRPVRLVRGKLLFTEEELERAVQEAIAGTSAASADVAAAVAG